MEVPQWLKNIWSRPVRNNYAESLIPKGLLNSNNNTTKKNTRLRPNAPAYIPKLSANAPEFTPAGQEVAPQSIPRTVGGKRSDKRIRRRQSRRKHKQKKGSKAGRK